MLTIVAYSAVAFFPGLAPSPTQYGSRTRPAVLYIGEAILENSRTDGFRTAQVDEPTAIQPRRDVTSTEIVATGLNSRRISASVIVDASPSVVWQILSDYDNLAEHVPNLVESSRRPHPSGGIRLYQEGAQKIAGFNFRASLTMDMLEITDEGARSPTTIRFKLVESAMFSHFDGEWRVQTYSRTRRRDDPSQYDYKTRLTYVVNITPKGLVPIPALEWRIREDVPVNLRAVREASESLKESQQR